MDSRDSTTQSVAATTTAAVANREGSPSSVEDDRVLSVNAALAKDAALLFQSRKFDECLGILTQLLEKKSDDPKILHNIAIVDFFRDDCSDPKKLLSKLSNIKKRSQELACASGEHLEAVGTVGNKILGSRGSGGVAHQLSVSSSGGIFYPDESDTSVAGLNSAIIWYHLHDYAKALSILEPLYLNIQPIEETTALHICLLLLDVLLACHDATRSVDVLNYLERAFGVSCVSQGDSGSSVLQPSAHVVTKSSSVPSSSSTADGSNSDLADVNALENPLTRTLSEETLETMLSSLDIGGQNFAKSAGLSSPNDLLRPQPDRSLSTVDLKFKLQLYRVRFLLLTRNLKVAKREVKQAMNVARGRDSSMALLLKSQLEFARGNYRKAIKLLMASSNRTETAISSMIQNNLGCIYYQLGKYHISSVFFTKALTNCSSLRKEKPRNLLAISQDNSLLITYNCGMQYLACRKPMLAAACFQKASLVFYNKPLLWLRLAECCIMATEKGHIKSGGSQSGVKVRVIGKGKWRQLVTEDGISGNEQVGSSEKDAQASCINGQPKLSMSFARQCLFTALHLLETTEVKNSKSDTSEENESSEASKNVNPKNVSGLDPKASNPSLSTNGDIKEQKLGTNLEIIQNSVSHYGSIRRRENHMLKQALLSYLAYVELELENPLKALSCTKSLLEIPDCSRIYTFLGHVYAAEALCSLNRPNEAAKHLSVYISGENNVELPFSQDDFDRWLVEKTLDSEESSVTSKPEPDGAQGVVFLKPEEARGTLIANLAAMSALQGELQQASQFVTQALSLMPGRPEAILTAIYVDLRLGKAQEALTKLKQCKHIRFLPSNVQMNKSS
ncbi:LOW QUALITY PROTEIN: uncharacterized protein [Rutidosis leptorrhynchoides]|uniref:LOW QUALITY PROTEIN: uncharacterized protein n=1 Tax=Rutidosis leptorrhynchoides TaxID=125765 RepID=UPI003A994FB9